MNELEGRTGKGRWGVAQAEEPRALSRTETVVNWLTDAIAHGRLRPGEWLSENELAAILNVSRSPVREALRFLAADGLVEVYPRRGHFVAGLDAHDADNLYRARMLVEGEAVRLAVEAQLSESSIDMIRQLLQHMRESKDEPRAYFDCNLKLHTEIIKSCPNSTLADLTETLWRRSLRFRSIVLRLSGQVAKSLANHERLVAACVAGDAPLAQEVMLDILEDSRQRLLAELFIDTGGGIREMISRDVSG
jgi:DNA-binding GntR family transcriptional regulator